MKFIASVFLLLIFSESVFAVECYPPKPEIIQQWSTQLPDKISDLDLAARLVYAETLSTNCSDQKALIQPIALGITWIIQNRVKAAENSKAMELRFGKGIRGVIFKPQQFNSSLSSKYEISRWKDFLCPKDFKMFWVAEKAVESVFQNQSPSPFKDPLVTNTYYYRHFDQRPPEKRPAPPKWASPDHPLRDFGSFQLLESEKAFRQCIGFFKLK